MGYRCGNCNMDFQTRKEWLDHIADVHNSYFLEGDESNIIYHEKKLNEKIAKGDANAVKVLEHINVNRGV